jgi:hypothetical protein
MPEMMTEIELLPGPLMVNTRPTPLASTDNTSAPGPTISIESVKLGNVLEAVSQPV